MTSRILPPSEWHRLPPDVDRLPDGRHVRDLLSPETTEIHVVEQDGRILGAVTMLRVVHAECVWIDPRYRGHFGVVKRLLRGISATARRWGTKVVWGAGMDEPMFSILSRLGGVPVPGQSFVFPVKETSCHQS